MTKAQSDTPVPTKIFIHYLECLEKLLNNLQDHPNLLNERLAPDMLNLLQQARTATGFTLRSCCPLAGRKILSFSDNQTNLASILAEVKTTRAYLRDIPEKEFENYSTRKIETEAGFANLEFNGSDYFMMYTLPNFFFHYNMVFAILRKSNIAVGKADYDGFHQYPKGFSFVTADETAD